MQLQKHLAVVRFSHTSHNISDISIFPAYIMAILHCLIFTYLSSVKPVYLVNDIGGREHHITVMIDYGRPVYILSNVNNNKPRFSSLHSLVYLSNLVGQLLNHIGK